MAVKHGLGRGLGALIQATPATEPVLVQAATASAPVNTGQAGEVVRLPIARIRPNSFQPRRFFAREALDELTNSIRERGILQPLLVRRVGDDYELIAGERRLRAAGEARLADVPVIVMDVPDRAALELALVENLLRQDLNAIEEAEGYRDLAEKFGLTQEEIATRIGKARASVTNALRLLTLPPEVRTFVFEGLLSVGHAKVLLGLTNEAEQNRLAEEVVQERISVRELERRVARLQRVPRKPRELRSELPASHVARLSEWLHEHFGTSVRLQPCRTLANGKKAKGTIEVDFYSNEDLDRILGVLGMSDTP
ncbi:MAG: ParB/RepB/Spo0J family partition protein [bacterium]